MSIVGTAELKNNLSRYLRQVREGDEVIVTDRGVPVAKLVPLGGAESAPWPERLAAMVAEGVVTYDFQARAKARHAKVELGGDLASRLLVEDRGE